MCDFSRIYLLFAFHNTQDLKSLQWARLDGWNLCDPSNERAGRRASQSQSEVRAAVNLNCLFLFVWPLLLGSRPLSCEGRDPRSLISSLKSNQIKSSPLLNPADWKLLPPVPFWTREIRSWSKTKSWQGDKIRSLLMLLVSFILSLFLLLLLPSINLRSWWLCDDDKSDSRIAGSIVTQRTN